MLLAFLDLRTVLNETADAEAVIRDS